MTNKPKKRKAVTDADLAYLVEQAELAEQFCMRVCAHRPSDTIREVESEALDLGHGLMIALNAFRATRRTTR
jgi:predicted metal-dependent TIM-barrel fold hydrolase